MTRMMGDGVGGDATISNNKKREGYGWAHDRERGVRGEATIC